MLITLADFFCINILNILQDQQVSSAASASKTSSMINAVASTSSSGVRAGTRSKKQLSQEEINSNARKARFDRYLEITKQSDRPFNYQDVIIPVNDDENLVYSCEVLYCKEQALHPCKESCHLAFWDGYYPDRY